MFHYASVTPLGASRHGVEQVFAADLFHYAFRERREAVHLEMSQLKIRHNSNVGGMH
jgi:hypothetical protein